MVPRTPRNLQRNQKHSRRIKLDQGYKSLLRGIRKAFKKSFAEHMVPKIRPNGLIKYDDAGEVVLETIETGKHHWTEERWLQKS